MAVLCELPNLVGKRIAALSEEARRVDLAVR
jgi:hypothetical protein